jgi:hypothetical protein
MSTVRRVMRYIQPDAIWTAALASVALYFTDYRVSGILLLCCSLSFITRKEEFRARFVNLVVFTTAGYHAAHRFDSSKFEDWFVGVLLPMFIIISLMRLVTNIELKIRGVQVFSSLLRKVRLHYIPFSVFAGILVTWLVEDKFTVYGGAACILFLLLFIETRLKVKSGLTMVGVYLIITELFIKQGIIKLKLEPVTFLLANWDQLLAPLLIMLVMFIAIRRVSQRVI